MHNLEYQKDWLPSMEELKLDVIRDAESSHGVLLFNAPQGEEKKWEVIFESHILKVIELWSGLN